MNADLNEYILQSRQIPFIRVIGSFVWSKYFPAGPIRAIVNIVSQLGLYLYNLRVARTVTGNYVRKRLTMEQNLFYRTLGVVEKCCYPFYLISMGLDLVLQEYRSRSSLSLFAVALLAVHARTLVSKLKGVFAIYPIESFIVDNSFRILSWFSMAYDTMSLLAYGKVYSSPQFGLSPYYLILASVPTNQGWISGILAKQEEITTDTSKWLGVAVPMWSSVLYAFGGYSGDENRKALSKFTSLAFLLEYFQRSYRSSIPEGEESVLIKTYQYFTNEAALDGLGAKNLLNSVYLGSIALGITGAFVPFLGSVNLFLSYLPYLINHVFLCFRLFVNKEFIALVSPEVVLGHAVFLYSLVGLVI